MGAYVWPIVILLAVIIGIFLAVRELQRRGVLPSWPRRQAPTRTVPTPVPSPTQESGWPPARPVEAAAAPALSQQAAADETSPRDKFAQRLQVMARYKEWSNKRGQRFYVALVGNEAYVLVYYHKNRPADTHRVVCPVGSGDVMAGKETAYDGQRTHIATDTLAPVSEVEMEFLLLDLTSAYALAQP